ncbi:MAG: hypothetical protein LUQ45_03965, partial [Methanoregulaceae archaeon]|nr:hypothetical protein [Methanoregulaceae archaeon]
ADLLCEFNGLDYWGNQLYIAQCFDPNINQVIPLTSLPEDFAQFNPGGQAVVNNKVYIFGGFNNSPIRLQSIQTWEFDPITAIWTQKGDLSLPRGDIDVAVVDGLIYAFGGSIWDGSTFVPQTIAEVFDPSTGTWDDAAVLDLPVATAGGRAFGFDSDLNLGTHGKAIVVGGVQGSGDTAETFSYDVETNSYNYDLPDLNISRRGQAGFFIPGETGQMWVFGGKSSAPGYGGDNPPYAPPEHYLVNFAPSHPEISVTSPPLDTFLQAYDTTTITFTLGSSGTLPLYWSITEVPGLLNINTSGTSALEKKNDISFGPEPSANSQIPTNNPEPFSAIDLVLDDGSAETYTGYSIGTELLFLNLFTPDPSSFPFQIDRVSVYFMAGLTQVGDRMTLVLYETPSEDFDPAVGANLLAAFPVTVQALDAFNDYELPMPVSFNGPGDVLVGVIAMDVDDDGWQPAAVDNTASLGHSWEGIWTSEFPPDPPTLPPDQVWTLIDNVGIPGNWLIRASGHTEGIEVPWMAEDPVSGTLLPGDNSEVSLTFDPAGLPLGNYFSQLDILSNDPDTHQVSLPVTMTVEIPDPLSVDPPSLAFGEVHVGISNTLPIAIFNMGWHSHEISSIEIDNPSFTTPYTGSIIQVMDYAPAEITFLPSEEGFITGNVTFVSDAGEITLPVSGEGVLPSISVSPVVITDTLAAGEILNKTLVISNTGGEDLTWNTFIKSEEVIQDFQSGFPISQFSLLNNATYNAGEGNVYLTTAASGQVGGLFYNDLISTDYLDLTFDFSIGGGDGADGMSVGFIDSPALGGGGGDLGFYNSGVDGWGLEFDTCQNGDESGNHIALVRPDGTNYITNNDIPYLDYIGTFTVELIYDNRQVSVYLENPDIGYPKTLVIDFSLPDTGRIYGYLGFTAGTGWYTNNHIVDNI